MFLMFLALGRTDNSGKKKQRKHLYCQPSKISCPFCGRDPSAIQRRYQIPWNCWPSLSWQVSGGVTMMVGSKLLLLLFIRTACIYLPQQSECFGSNFSRSMYSLYSPVFLYWEGSSDPFNGGFCADGRKVTCHSGHGCARPVFAVTCATWQLFPLHTSTRVEVYDCIASLSNPKYTYYKQHLQIPNI